MCTTYDRNCIEHVTTIVQNNERLLKLYESGLPVWAIFLPTYGLYYRPWMRRLTWILFIAVSIFSMACGLYDLYKNVPHVDKVCPSLLWCCMLLAWKHLACISSGLKCSSLQYCAVDAIATASIASSLQTHLWEHAAVLHGSNL